MNKDEQEEVFINSLRAIEGLRDEVWETLSPNQRLKVLQSVVESNHLAFGYQKADVKTFLGGEGHFSWWDEISNTIYVNESVIARNDAKRAVTCILHCLHYVSRFDVLRRANLYPEFDEQYRSKLKKSLDEKVPPKPTLSRFSCYDFYPEIQPGNSRRPHYDAAYSEIPRLLLNPARQADYLAILVGPNRKKFLADVWTMTGSRYPEHERVPAVGLDCNLYRFHDGLFCALITFPAPRHACEAFMSAVVFSEDDFLKTRYFCCEVTAQQAEGEPGCTLAEIRSGENQTTRLNYGDGLQPTEDCFLHLIREVIEDRKAPLAVQTFPSETSKGMVH